VNILLTEKSEEAWFFTYRCVRCNDPKSFKDGKHPPVDLFGIAFMRGYTHLSGLYLKILSYSSFVSEENVSKHKFEEFEKKFLDEVNKSEEDKLKCMTLRILLLSFVDYTKDRSTSKNLLKPLKNEMLEESKRNITGGNLNVDSNSILEKYGPTSIEWTCFLLLSKAYVLKNCEIDASTKGMEDTQPREAQFNHREGGRYQGTAPQMNNRGGKGGRQGSGNRR
jgi:hypothetical protein